MNRRNQDAQSNETVERRAVDAGRGRPTSRRSADGTNGAARIDLALVYCAIGLSLAVIPLLVGYAFVVGPVPSPGSPAFGALGAVVMAPGLLMGAAVLWLCARSD